MGKRLVITLSDEEHAACVRVAREDDRPVSSWARRVLKGACAAESEPVKVEGEGGEA